MTHKCHPFPLALNIRCIAGQTERPDGQMDIIYATGAFASTPCWTLNLGRNIVFANKIQVQKDSCCRARLLIERKTNSNCWKQLCFVPSLIPHRLKPCQQKFKSPSKFHRDQSTSPQTEAMKCLWIILTWCWKLFVMIVTMGLTGTLRRRRRPNIRCAVSLTYPVQLTNCTGCPPKSLWLTGKPS